MFDKNMIGGGGGGGGGGCWCNRLRSSRLSVHEAWKMFFLLSGRECSRSMSLVAFKSESFSQYKQTSYGIPRHIAFFTSN